MKQSAQATIIFCFEGWQPVPIRKTLKQGLAKLETVDERQIVSQPTMAKGHSPLSAIVQSGLGVGVDLQDVGIMNATTELFFFAPLCQVQVDYCWAKPVEKVEKRKVCRYKYIYIL